MRKPSDTHILLGTILIFSLLIHGVFIVAADAGTNVTNDGNDTTNAKINAIVDELNATNDKINTLTAALNTTHAANATNVINDTYTRFAEENTELFS
jgi:septal ring factor EnvC (AmiA/AmiB activator)